MILLRLSEPDFEYDIYSLAKAFFPKEEVVWEGKGSAQKEAEQEILSVEYKEKNIRISWIKAATDAICAAKTVSIEGLDRGKVKSLLKKAIYEMLSEETNTTLPWGTLTGIRPTKIPFGMLKEGKSQQEVRKYMKETYLTSEQKTSLSVEIAQRESEILKNIDYENGYSLYVGIPFCPTRCLYCSFTSYPISMWENRIDDYLAALVKEVEFVSEKMKHKRLNTVYIGGGTPTTLNKEQLKSLLYKITEQFDLSYNQEFTLEAGRPDSVTKEKLTVMKQEGITRISVNPQTMRQKTLDLIGRNHTVEQTRDTFFLARECGFDNINMDIIAGLPGETKEDMEYTMQQLLAMKPDSLTVHALAVKRASRLYELKEQYEEYTSVNNEEIALMVEAYARSMKLHPYYLYRQKNMTGNLENVGYAALDKAGIYNILIMEERQSIIALGAGAVTKIVYPDGKRIERISNVKNAEQYIDRIDEMIERKQKGELSYGID